MKPPRPIEMYLITSSEESVLPERTESRSTVRKAPGSAIRSAARIIPFKPKVFLPTPAAISTGRAPGVTQAETTSSS